MYFIFFESFKSTNINHKLFEFFLNHITQIVVSIKV